MVAERVVEISDPKTDQSACTSSASSVPPSMMSKKEVASLIRYGANAIFEAGRGNDYTDDDLEVLLGSKGVERSESSSLEAPKRFLEEIDLRELDGIMYERKDGVGSGSLALEKSMMNKDGALGEILGKRNRKQRVALIDGDEMAKEEGKDWKRSDSSRKKTRKNWSHMDTCLICNELTNSDQNGNLKGKPAALQCAHCPRTAHASCLESFNRTPSSSSGGISGFTCFQHRCKGCDRTTSAAGGLLFRCVSCPSAFCEDCLQEDSVESIGRWREVEKLGYVSKQAYWIKCERCLGGVDEDEEFEVNEGSANKG
eukprot:CAMPEP_0171456008 /NCGR_PEP_ID=MMETSP0945-20130129/2674_1 /TAXON_ID=109269 /ORGANISM="Vaucheria litorea, Strain CCMP2940" /LENGTH=312 /DNA_ID=CAMNT_0011981361 /DNA_START=124 /DNA_END=1063 /DNA_ORIENTATION=-